jgi:hypothetical protein
MVFPPRKSCVLPMCRYVLSAFLQRSVMWTGLPKYGLLVLYCV